MVLTASVLVIAHISSFYIGDHLFVIFSGKFLINKLPLIHPPPPPPPPFDINNFEGLSGQF